MEIETADRIARIAADLFRQHQAREPYAWPEGREAPATLEEAYEVQFELQEQFIEAGLGGLAGHKIALTSKAMQAFCGVDHPIAGGIFASTIRSGPCEVAAADFQRLGIEFELAFEIGRAARGGPYDEASVRDLVSGCRPAFELIEDRRADYDALGALGLAADNAWCGGVVLGSPIEDWRSLDLDALPVTLFYNDETPDKAVTGAAEPWKSLAWVANHLIGFGRALEPGQIVITGSALKTRFPEPGDAIRYEIDGIAEVAVDIR